MACDNNTALADRILPFSPLLRRDDNDTPLVITPGSLYVTRTGDRRSTGTHYTPPSLSEPLVRHTLEPLVYDGPADGKPRAEWRLRTPREILALRVCDIAMGSGALLVQACRFLAEHLVEAWEEVERTAPGRVLITPEGDLSAGEPGERLIPGDPDERLIIARRLVADRCLYGVDKNPQAVEMAKLSLWLVTSAKGRPFTFLDHALRCGDSLIGADEETFLKWTQLGGKKAGTLYDDELHRALDVARAKRRELESFEVKDVRDAERKAALLAEAERATARVKLGCDLIVGIRLLGLNARDEKARLLEAFVAFQHTSLALEGRGQEEGGPMNDYAVLEPLREAARTRAFHWHLEFPDIFADGGFSAFMSNPPFVGGQKITGTLGVPYRDHLVKNIARGQRGSADLCAYFFLRAHDLLRPGGTFGLLATNTIAQGDTREVGLDQIATAGGTIYRAVPSMPWPGEANLEVAAVWSRKGAWEGEITLDGKPVAGITPFLTVPGTVEGKPHRLTANANKSFQGSIVLGMGFVLTPEEAQDLIAQNPKNKDILFPYLNGEDLNSRPDQSPSRWVINFHDWPLHKNSSPSRGVGRAGVGTGSNASMAVLAPSPSWTQADVKQRKLWLREGIVPVDYPDPVAADYPDCLKIVEEKVKPDRARLAAGDATARDRAHRWWQFARPTLKLYATIAGLDRVLACSEVTKHLAFGFMPLGIVYSANLDIFVFRWEEALALLQSSIHEAWGRKYSATLETRLKYSPGNAFETFPFPEGFNHTPPSPSPRGRGIDADPSPQGQAVPGYPSPSRGEGRAGVAPNTGTPSTGMALSSLADIGSRYYTHRQSIMLARAEGLTATYNRFHNPKETSADIARLRDLHIEMDNAVAAAYGWTDLTLGHGFHETKHGLRFTLSDPSRREVLSRLLSLNHARHAAAKQAAVEPASIGRRKKKPPVSTQAGLFDSGKASE